MISLPESSCNLFILSNIFLIVTLICVDEGDAVQTGTGVHRAEVAREGHREPSGRCESTADTGLNSATGSDDQ